MRSAGVAAAAATALSLAAAPVAHAADYYVDRDVANGSVTCTLASPCDTIDEALTLADGSDATVDTVHVGFSTTAYGAITVPDTPVSLIGDDFNAPATAGTETIIDGNAAAGVTMAAGALARTIDGFTIQGGDSAGAVPSLNTLAALTGVTIEDNLFNESSVDLDQHIWGNGSPTIIDNVVTGAGQVHGIEILSAGSPVISGNTISGAARSIDVQGATATITIEDNAIQVDGTNPIAPNAGIFLLASRGDVRRNLITMNPGATNVQTDGIYVTNTSGNTLRLTQNQILGFTQAASYGMDRTGMSTDPTTLVGDVLAGNRVGLSTNTTGPLSLTNVTIWGGTGAGLVLSNALAATVDSSIVSDGGITLSGGATCTSSFSRGPAGELDCGPFATTAMPSFASLALDGTGYRLTTAGNPSLIDLGNPAALGIGEPTVDIEDDDRVLDGITDGVCLARRDVGADEVVVPPSNCQSLPGTPSTPATGAAITGLRAAALKKCKRKKPKKARRKCRRRARKLPV